MLPWEEGEDELDSVYGDLQALEQDEPFGVQADQPQGSKPDGVNELLPQLRRSDRRGKSRGKKGKQPSKPELQNKKANTPPLLPPITSPDPLDEIVRTLALCPQPQTNSSSDRITKAFTYTRSDLKRHRNDAESTTSSDEEGSESRGKHLVRKRRRETRKVSIVDGVWRKWEEMTAGKSDGLLPKYPYAYDEEGKGLSIIFMIRLVIAASPAKQLTLSQIYQAVEERWPGLKDKEMTWRNSARHSLSLNDCFVKLERQKGQRGKNKGSYWAVAHTADHSSSSSRRTRSRPGQASTGLTNPFATATVPPQSMIERSTRRRAGRSGSPATSTTGTSTQLSRHRSESFATTQNTSSARSSSLVTLTPGANDHPDSPTASTTEMALHQPTTSQSSIPTKLQQGTNPVGPPAMPHYTAYVPVSLPPAYQHPPIFPHGFHPAFAHLPALLLPPPSISPGEEPLGSRVIARATSSHDDESDRQRADSGRVELSTHAFSPATARIAPPELHGDASVRGAPAVHPVIQRPECHPAENAVRRGSPMDLRSLLS